MDRGRATPSAKTPSNCSLPEKSASVTVRRLMVVAFSETDSLTGSGTSQSISSEGGLSE